MDDTFDKGALLQDSFSWKSTEGFESNSDVEETKINGQDQYDSCSRPNVNGNRTGPCAAKVLNDVSLLYIAFKRADVGNSGFATIEDIRKSFFEDHVVHSIFGLGVTQSKSELSGHITLNDSPQILLNLVPVRFDDKNKMSDLKETEQIHKDISLEYLKNTIVSFFCQFKNPFSNGFALNKWRNYIDTMLSFDKCKDWYFNECFKQKLKAQTEWTVESKKKLDNMLVSLRRIEINEIRCLSRRQNTCVTVRFPEYVAAFFMYVASTHPALFNTNTFLQLTCNVEPIREKDMRLTLAEQFVRDSYLGTCITNYVQTLLAWRCRHLSISNHFTHLLYSITYESVLPRHLSLPKTFVMESLIPGLAPDNKILFRDALLSTTLSKGSRLRASKNKNKGYFQNEMQHRVLSDQFRSNNFFHSSVARHQTPLSQTKRENLTKELQILQRKIRASQENRI